VNDSRVPAPLEGVARSLHRFGAAVGPRGFVLLAISFLWIGPALFEHRFLYAMGAWDLAIVACWLLDVARLPEPGRLSVRRSWLAPATLSVGSAVRLTVVNRSSRPIRARIVDAIPPQLGSQVPDVEVIVGPGAAVDGEYRILPRERGAIAVGSAYLRYQSALGIAERWARVDLDQTIVSYPSLEEAKRESIYSVKSRQMDAERRSRALRGAGRLFEGLRDYRDGDEFRDICWTASARRGKPVTRLYEHERSQPIWVVIDAGRLMRARLGDMTKLDHAVNAALTLAQVAIASGDRVGVLAYDRRIVHCVPPGRGRSHLRQILEHLARVQPAESEADHVSAAGRLLTEQKRRSLVVWMTDVPDSAMAPEVIQAASQLTPRHLVLFVVIGQPDLARVVDRRPSSADEMYHVAAAQEVVHRRDLLLAGVRARGVLAIEATGMLSPALVNAYLGVKRQGRL
jgi:uncharacterized protein (DUF58 family)